MQNVRKNYNTIAAGAIALGSLLGCATSSVADLPRLEFRKLRLSTEKLGFAEYQWRECVSRIMFCTKWELRKEFYNLSDLPTVTKLNAAGMVLQVRETPK